MGDTPSGAPGQNLDNKLTGQIDGSVVQAQSIHDVHFHDREPQRPERIIPRQLPGEPSHFVGRDRELRTMSKLLRRDLADSGTVVISAIGGSAGVGKTALAIHWAHQVARYFPDGQFYVNLRGFDPGGPPIQSAEAVRGFLDALQVPPERIPVSQDGQAALYRSMVAGQRVLVVLDNARDVEQVRPLLPGSPTCVVIVTSRNTLGELLVQDGAHLLDLDVLTPAEAVELLRSVTGPQRVDEEPAAGVKLVELCGYLPLAIRIAAGRLRTRPRWSVGQLVNRLIDERRRLGELSIGDSGIRTSFTLSYRELAPPTARMFRLVGLVPGPDFGVGVASALTGAPAIEAEQALEALVDLHLVEPAPAPDRYRLHDLMRLYAGEQARTDSGIGAACDRMTTWYVETAHCADRLLDPDRNCALRADMRPRPCPSLATRDEALNWLETERLNLIAAIRYLVDDDRRPGSWQLPDALWSFFYIRKHWADWQSTFQLGLSAARTAGDEQAQAEMLSGLAMAYRDVRLFAKAIECYENALALCRRIGYRYREGHVLTHLGNVYAAVGRFDKAVECCRAALQLHRATGHRHGEADTLLFLGQMHVNAKQFTEALPHLEQAVSLHRETGRPYGEADSLPELGQVYENLGEFDQAIACYRTTIGLCRRAGYLHRQAEALTHLARVMEQTDHVDEARAALEEALAILTGMGAAETGLVRSRLAALS
jgi:tetratricopeptide (TPR) repeat protein